MIFALAGLFVAGCGMILDDSCCDTTIISTSTDVVYLEWDDTSASVTVNSGAPWLIQSIVPGGITVSPETSDAPSVALTITPAAPNTTTADKVYTVSFLAANGDEITLQVVHKQPHLVVDPTDMIEFEWNGNLFSTDDTFDVSYPLSYTVTLDDMVPAPDPAATPPVREWVDFTAPLLASYTGDQTFTVNSQDNNFSNTNYFTATITITAENGEVVTIPVRQQPIDAMVVTADSPIEFLFDGTLDSTSDEVTVTYPNGWTWVATPDIESGNPGDWLSYSATGLFATGIGDGDDVITFTAAANIGAARSVSIEFFDGGGNLVSTVVVNQEENYLIDNMTDLIAAIIAAAPGDHLYLDPLGTFTLSGDRLYINKDIFIHGNNATLQFDNPTSIGATDAVLTWAGEYPSIYIDGGADVYMENLTITATAAAGQPVDGITLDGAKITLSGVEFNGIHNANGLGNTQYGRAITAFDSGVEAYNCVFQDINKNAIHLFGTSDAQIDFCSFFGHNVGGFGHNGIVFMIDGGHNTTGKVSDCKFEDFLFDSGLTNNSCAVLVYNSGANVTGVTIIDDGGNTYVNCDHGWEEGI